MGKGEWERMSHAKTRGRTLENNGGSRHGKALKRVKLYMAHRRIRRTGQLAAAFGEYIHGVSFHCVSSNFFRLSQLIFL
jgi:hypothetical protein